MATMTEAFATMLVGLLGAFVAFGMGYDTGARLCRRCGREMSDEDSSSDEGT